MDYKEKYEMALEGIQEILGSGEDSIKMSRLQLRLQGIFPELKESEDEKIRKAIHIYLDWLDGKKDYAPKGEYTINDMIDWIEKQGKHQKFRDSIQVGDKVTRNQDGVLVNQSQLKRVAKKDDKQGEQKQELLTKEKALKNSPFVEQKPADKVEHKFKVGNEINTANEEPLTITKIDEKGYWSEDLFICGFDEECCWDLVEKKPAWSKEDEDNMMMIEDRLSDYLDYIREDTSLTKRQKNSMKEEVIGYVNWLKSLKERYAWKPNDEQMDALRYVTNFDYGGHKATLVSLYEQLKKLK